MDNRGITWACSRCDARFSTKEELDAHGAEHEGRASLSRPSTLDVPAGVLAAGKTRQTDARQSNQPRPDATAASSGGKPAAAQEGLSPRVTRTSSRRALRWVALAAVCAVATGLGLAFPHQIAHQITLAVTKQPTPFTELYFSNPNGLPKSLSLSRPNLFRFTVVNHEGRDIEYEYVVTLSSPYGVSTIAQGRIRLASNQSATSLVDVRPTRGATEYVTTVSLLGRAEVIRFRAISQ